MTYYSDQQITLLHGQALDQLRTLPDASVDCCVTSPPYFGLRDYKIPGQIGLEESPYDYVAKLAAIFHEVKRVLAPDGTCWLNLGDSYAGKANGGPTRDRHRGHGHRGGVVANQRNLLAYAPYKSLLGIPWRVALELQDDGWIIRNEIIWHKPNAMPESVDDRLKSAHETLFLLTKSPRYWFNLDPVRLPAKPDPRQRDDYEPERYRNRGGRTDGLTSLKGVAWHANGSNPGDVWSINTVGFPEAHFATMPPALAERCVVAGCKPNGVVLDPFSGVGTTGMVATKHGHRYIGIELSADTLDLSLKTRLSQSTLVEEVV